MKYGLWGNVNGTETRPPASESEKKYIKFNTRWDRALAIIVLSVDSSLLYLVGEPTDPIVVWKMLAAQFRKKTWANKLHLRRKLYSLKLKEGGSVQEHIKAMTETFSELSVIGDPITEEDRVVHLLASLADSYNVLVTALEANADMPKMEVVTEHLLHEERKNMDNGTPRYDNEKVMTVRRNCSGCCKTSRPSLLLDLSVIATASVCDKNWWNWGTVA